MKISPLPQGCVHLSRGPFNAIFGCPSEILKRILAKQLAMPECVVLPDNFHHEGVSLVAVEFPFYHFIFMQGALGQGRKFRIIGSKKNCDRVREMLRVTQRGGHILLCDWRYSKPGSATHRAVTQKRIAELFEIGRQTNHCAVFAGPLVPPAGRFLSRRVPSAYFLVSRLLPFLVGQVTTVLRKSPFESAQDS